MKHIHKNKQGYAIVIVMILMIIGAGIVLLSNKENLFHTKLMGFFNRSKQIQSHAEAGIDLAKIDLQAIAFQSISEDISGMDVFTQLQTGGQVAAIDQGLMFDDSVTRDVTHRSGISKVMGDFDIKVYYFPEDPCTIGVTCDDDQDYNRVLPKFFTVVSQATHLKTQEVFTIETHLQLRLENFSEIAFGVLGATDYPDLLTDSFSYHFTPSVYGRLHFNLSKNRIMFDKERADYNLPPPQRTWGEHIFKGLVTFEKRPSGETDEWQAHDGEYYPFRLQGGSASSTQTGDPTTQWKQDYHSAKLDFQQGYKKDVELIAETDTYLDPSSDTYFAGLETLADDFGIKITDDGTSDVLGLSCDANNVMDVCLKMNGASILKYACNKNKNSGTYLEPRVDIVMAADDWGNMDLDGSGTVDVNDDVTDLPERYTGERADVFGGSLSNGVNIGPTQGVVHCKSSNPSCKCRLHIKGIYAGSVTVAADDVVIEGDIVNQNQDPTGSDYTFGMIAKNDIIIPAGLPQAANNLPYDKQVDDHTYSTLTANDPPFENCSTPGAACTPASLAESYLGITNFIAHDGSGYVDRDTGIVYDADGDEIPNPYKQNAAWIDHDDTFAANAGEYYNSPMSLDLDGHFYAGNVIKVDGIFNPEVDPNDWDGNNRTDGRAILTCEDAACTDVKYRHLGTSTPTDPDPDALYEISGYEADGVTPIWGHYGFDPADPLTTGVQPVFYADGAHNNYTYIFPHPHDGPDAIGSGHNGLNNQYDLSNDTYEAVPRARNQSLHVFGSMNSKFFFVNSKMGPGSVSFGFDNKIIQEDPRGGAIIPPGFPATTRMIVHEMKRKTQHGVSQLLN